MIFDGTFYVLLCFNLKSFRIHIHVRARTYEYHRHRNDIVCVVSFSGEKSVWHSLCILCSRQQQADKQQHHFAKEKRRKIDTWALASNVTWHSSNIYTNIIQTHTHTGMLYSSSTSSSLGGHLYLKLKLFVYKQVLITHASLSFPTIHMILMCTLH